LHLRAHPGQIFFDGRGSCANGCRFHGAHLLHFEISFSAINLSVIYRYPSRKWRFALLPVEFIRTDDCCKNATNLCKVTSDVEKAIVNK
ncbi:MAG: hypothetical protein VXY12_06795, partial [Pseudomonadota bacterium]|nr:hypothetical protein [Pseudomonadota bacterium]